MDLLFEPVRITSKDISEAMLVFRGGSVVAIVSRLSDAYGDELTGRYYVECAFGEDAEHKIFPAFDDMKMALEAIKPIDC